MQRVVSYIGKSSQPFKASNFQEFHSLLNITNVNKPDVRYSDPRPTSNSDLPLLKYQRLTQIRIQVDLCSI